MQTDIYTRVTETIIAALAEGVRPWTRPWSDNPGGPVQRPLRHNGEPYSGINVVMLWSAAAARGYAAPVWMTYRQAQALGGQVRKGERGSPVVFAKTLTIEEIDSRTGESQLREVPLMRSYRVFNVEQVDGLPRHFDAPVHSAAPPDPDLAEASRFFERLGVDIRHGGRDAYYAIAADQVRVPVPSRFRDAEAYYATLAHECVHWTRHPSRLNRDFGAARPGDAGYAMEELVAEIGSAFLAADLGIALEVREDHAPYIASWLRVLNDDVRAIFAAAAHAQRAVDFLHGRAGEPARTGIARAA